MGHYIANLRDIQFCLFELLGRDQLLGKGLFSDIDLDTANGMLEEMKRLSENEIAASFVEGDRLGVEFDPKTGEGKLPESFKKSYRAYMDAEWWRIDAPVEIGGTLIPRSLRWAMAEMILGANPALHIYVSASFAHVAYALGTPEQQKFAKLMLDKEWTATMVLTEPDAGSDVGAGRSKAVKQADGSWHITGTKRFITSGEHDLSENIIHFVLARPEGGAVGTKGLSLFLVPKYHFDWNSGELGKRNGVYATRLEEKMGLNISATAELNMGEKEPCVGYLLGEVHDGIRQMFKIIEYARMMVGTKAISTLSTGYLNALSYAKSRVQGPDLTKMMDKASPRVTIINHPDVRRSLLTQKAYAEGMRALVLYTASIQDAILMEQDAEKLKHLEKFNDLLLPIVKGYGSEKSWILLGTECLQTFGGSGFTQDWPLEQYVRDAKIDTLYEGTTAIQGLDFFFRKIVRDNGATLMSLGAEINAFCESGGAFIDEKAKLLKALGDFQGIITVLVGHAISSQASQENSKEIYKVGLNTTRALFAAGDVVVGWLLLRMAEIAESKMTAGNNDDFYLGKIAAAKHFINVVLPHLSIERKIAETTDGSIMELPEKAF
jgi:alkylation response protein AidB-like acyl-CoA dehydrogenase